MNTQAVLAGLAELGIRVEFRQDGSPVLRGPRSELSDAVLRVAKIHRQRILELVRPQVRLYTPEAEPPGKVVEMQFATGLIEKHHFDGETFPAGFWWWREPGGEWRAIPGRGGVGRVPPEGGNE